MKELYSGGKRSGDQGSKGLVLEIFTRFEKGSLQIYQLQGGKGDQINVWYSPRLAGPEDPVAALADFSMAVIEYSVHFRVADLIRSGIRILPALINRFQAAIWPCILNMQLDNLEGEDTVLWQNEQIDDIKLRQIGKALMKNSK